jgi:hypothetical protein
MSTSYYYISEPFTHIRLDEGPAHDRVTLFESHACSGVLTVSRGQGLSLVRRFAAYCEDSQAPMRTHFGGRGVGCVVTENVRGLADDLVLISEYGEALTVGEIRARSGHGAAADAVIGELFGYGKGDKDGE